MPLRVKHVNWQHHCHEVKTLREKVFVIEWRIPQNIEFDRSDDSAYHVVVESDDKQAVATGRLTPEGELGRIAVRREWRKREVYDTLVSALLDIARSQKIESICVQCDIDAVPRYQELGFTPVGPAYMDAGIPRRKMACPVQQCQLAHIEFMH
ncbi:GNAT family N-acetyltransferase [Bowmanella sp. JS7-9]|uniref:GNAT family N-acetyltransferase n=1 Tax=Pseudobowmanella zhangzhouensis TaxID=1537679 RepID=A0ABW1XL33_9ALTE|nr:GNAT family N-acetyltransferase [Bowmanella sp. JS7-9]TBX27458.1 hypothetical protein TK45_01585 [Bowmanella sp. JS7-9]